VGGQIRQEVEMRRIALLVAAPLAGLAFAALATAGGGDDGGYGTGPGSTSETTTATETSEQKADDDAYTYRAGLNAKQEVPTPKGAAKAIGAFVAIVTEQHGKATLRWTLTFRRLSGKAVAAHIHLGKRGVAGGVIEALCGPCRTGQSGTKVLSKDANDALEEGKAYVNVHTPKNAAGEIRGQVGRGALVYRVPLTSAQEVPKPQSAAGAKGLFIGRVLATGAKGTLRWKLSFSGLTGPATAAHVHVARKGKAGDVAVSLCGPCRKGQGGNAALDDSTLRAIAAGGAYVNVHTERNQAGEVRGQLSKAG
jgi:CHRD domain